MYPASTLDEAFERISQRRSVKAADICEPGPSDDQIEQILQAAAQVPDHGKLGPWRSFYLKANPDRLLVTF